MFVLRNFQKQFNQNIHINSFTCYLNHKNFNFKRFVSNIPSEYGYTRDPAPLFFNNEVQSLLKSLTRIDLKKVFSKRKLGGKALELPTYKFMTDEQLKETMMEAELQANELLQMPPIVQIRKSIDKILSQDSALRGYETTKFVFTDITFGVKDCDRLIVVREPSGTLKEASWEVRDRMNQIYFPKIGRKVMVPKMFQDEFLEDLLVRSEYIFVLDRACTQFEPNSPDYHRVTNTTYEHINENKAFEKLRSTRHFGPMTFYLIWFKKIDNLLLELIETSHIVDANNLLKLYSKIHDIQFNIEDVQSLDGIMIYITQESQKKALLELAFQAYKDLESQRRKLQEGIQAAHGFV